MSFPQLSVEHEGVRKRFFPKQIDREKRIFVGEVYRFLTTEEREAWVAERGWMPIEGRQYRAPATVSFDQVKGANTEAAIAFRLTDEVPVWADGHSADRKLDAYRNMIKSGK